MAYLVLYAKDSFDVSAVRAAQFLAIAQVGGTVSRVLWGVVSDRSFGGRRRPGVVASAAIGAASYAALALGSLLPVWLVYPLAFVAGAGAFGWVGLYFALVAEIGGPRHAGLLTARRRPVRGAARSWVRRSSAWSRSDRRLRGVLAHPDGGRAGRGPHASPPVAARAARLTADMAD